MKFFIFIVALFSLVTSSHAAQVSIIIDDMGNHKREELAFSLPTEVVFAILPNKRLSEPFSLKAAAQNREVILHMPMESLARQNQEQDLLLSSMRPDEIVQTLDAALKTVPHAVGINNHMGSRLTQLTLPMSVTMEYLAKHDLIFVDSRTTRFSKAANIAQKKGVLTAKRNVFLDHDLNMDKIDEQFQRLIRIAKKYGYAVGIAHPHSESLEYLARHLSSLNSKGVKLVKLTHALLPQTELAYQPSGAVKK